MVAGGGAFPSSTSSTSRPAPSTLEVDGLLQSHTEGQSIIHSFLAPQSMLVLSGRQSGIEPATVLLQAASADLHEVTLPPLNVNPGSLTHHKSTYCTSNSFFLSSYSIHTS